MFLAMAKDLRVVIIGLAWRVYEMEALDAVDDEKQRAVFANETLNVYVPLAARLGIYRMRAQLEDLSFKYVHVQEHLDLKEQIDIFGKTWGHCIALVQEELEKFLKARGIEASVSGRLKGLYSIHKKLKKKNLNSVDDLFDIFAMRIILPSSYEENGTEGFENLYSVLGMIHSAWKPISKRFKDYIAVPKPNGYRSLHTVVLGIAPKDRQQPVEIQIRSNDMHREAEYGIASHWLYKNIENKVYLKSQIDWLRALENFHHDFLSDDSVMKAVEVDVFKDRIFVLTPRGEVKDLIVGATPIDFAYSIHTDVGNRCIMAKIDGHVVPLDYELENGDVVEIMTRKDATPKLQWLSIAKTGFARSKIRSWFTAFDRENNVREGRILLNKHLKRVGKPILDQNYTILKNFGGQKLNLSQREGVLEEVGKGGKLANDVIRNIFPYQDLLDARRKLGILPKTKKKSRVEKFVLRGDGAVEDRVLVGGESGLPLKIAACCKPKIGNKIIGYVTRGNSITIHRASCSLLDTLDSDRVVYASWKGMHMDIGLDKYRVGMKLSVTSRLGLIRDITSVISDFDGSIIDLKITKEAKGLHDDYFVLDFSNLDKLDLLMDKLESIDGVVRVLQEPYKE